MSDSVEFLEAKTLYRTAVVKVELLVSKMGEPIRVKETHMVTVYVYESHGYYSVQAGFEGSDPDFVNTSLDWVPTQIGCAVVARKFVEDWMKKEKEE